MPQTVCGPGAEMCHSSLEAPSCAAPILVLDSIVCATGAGQQLKSVHDASCTLSLSRRLTALDSDSSYADSGVLVLVILS
jgi:hypothetical protein